MESVLLISYVLWYLRLKIEIKILECNEFRIACCFCFFVRNFDTQKQLLVFSRGFKPVVYARAECVIPSGQTEQTRLT